MRFRSLVITSLCLFVAACGGGSGQVGPNLSSSNPALSLENQSPTSLANIASGFENSGDRGQALVFYGEAVAKDPKMELAWLGIARVLKNSGNMVGAKAALMDALVQLPDSLELGIIAAELEIMSGNPQQAIVLLVPSINAPDYRVPNLMGVASEMMGSSDVAKDYYGKAMAYNRSAPDVLSNLALSFAISGDQVTAVALMQDNLRRSDYEDIALEHLAVIYALDGQVDAAMTLAADLMGTEDALENYDFYEGLQYLPSAMQARAIFTKQMTSEMQMIINRARE